MAGKQFSVGLLRGAPGNACTCSGLWERGPNYVTDNLFKDICIAKSLGWYEMVSLRINDDVFYVIQYNKGNILLWIMEQACLLVIIKESSSLSSRFLWHNPLCIQVSPGPLPRALWEPGPGNSAQENWSSGYCSCCYRDCCEQWSPLSLTQEYCICCQHLWRCVRVN